MLFFADEDIDGNSLLTLTREDLNELKLKLGHKKKVERLIQTLQNPPPKKTAEPTVSTANVQPSHQPSMMNVASMETFPIIVQPSVFSPNVPVSSPNFPVCSASFSVSSPTNYPLSSESVSILSSENISVLSPENVSVLSSASVSVLPSASVSILPSTSASVLPTTSVMVSSPICVPMSSSNVSVTSASAIPVQSAIPIVQLQPSVTHKVLMQQLPNIDSSSSPRRSERVYIPNLNFIICSPELSINLDFFCT